MNPAVCGQFLVSWGDFQLSLHAGHKLKNQICHRGQASRPCYHRGWGGVARQGEGDMSWACHIGVWSLVVSRLHSNGLESKVHSQYDYPGGTRERESSEGCDPTIANAKQTDSKSWRRETNLCAPSWMGGGAPRSWMDSFEKETQLNYKR